MLKVLTTQNIIKIRKCMVLIHRYSARSVLGGMTTFLFASVCVSGIKVISIDGFSRRTRFILAVSLGLGFGVTLVRCPMKERDARNLRLARASSICSMRKPGEPT